MEGFYGCFCPKVVLESDTFQVFDTVYQFFNINVSVLEVANLCSNPIIGNRTIYDVVLMNRFVCKILTIVIYETSPLLFLIF